jgi:2-keto-4-pentenoate hydratase/2-oxohepta-3-ene-1,7-dioic acid hydratase in catechol pathway
VKLCRFELKSTPGDIRSGIVYNGKVYETDGATPVAIHEAEDVRPLAPTGQPPSLRIFRATADIAARTNDAGYEPMYVYGNPNTLIGASQIVPEPDYSGSLDFEPYVAVVIASDGHRIPIEEADGYILGYTVINFLVARDVERSEKAMGLGPGKSYDLAAAIGPVLTTPDEMEDAIVDESDGRKFKLSVVARINGVERRRGDIEDLPWTLDRMIVAASESCPIREGDILCAGPIVDAGDGVLLTSGDEVQIAVEKLGTLAVKIG